MSRACADLELRWKLNLGLSSGRHGSSSCSGHSNVSAADSSSNGGDPSNDGSGIDLDDLSACDVLVHCGPDGGTSFPAHRAVLAASSRQLSALVQLSDLLGSDHIFLMGLDPRAARAFVRDCYLDADGASADVSSAATADLNFDDACRALLWCHRLGLAGGHLESALAGRAVDSCELTRTFDLLLFVAGFPRETRRLQVAARNLLSARREEILRDPSRVRMYPQEVINRACVEMDKHIQR